jgi:hypothetical protein
VIGLTSSAIDMAGISADAQKELVKDQRKLTVLEAQRATLAKAGQPTAKIDRKIADVKGEMAALQAVKEGKIDAATFKIQNEFLGGIDEGLGEAAKNPELLFYKIKTNAYKFSWALIPISVPFVWLLFPFSRRFRLYDHTVFVTYSLCFMSLLVVAGLVFGAAGMTGLAGLLWLLPPFHMYRQLKGAYSLRRAGALWRTALLTIFAMIVVGLFSAVLVGVGTFD